MNAPSLIATAWQKDSGMAHKRKLLLSILYLLISALLVSPAQSLAQEPIEPTLHWAYASFFGTGWYKINDERSAYILRMSPRWTSGKAQLHEDGRRDIAYTFRVPVTVGVNQLDFEDIPGILDPNNFTTASLNFSLDADIPVTSTFSIRPSAEVGYGTVLDESAWAWTYRTDIRTRNHFQSGKLDWAILFNLGLMGYEPNTGDSDYFVYAAAGLEFGYPVSWFTSANSQTMFYWHLSYVDFLDEIEVQSSIDEFDSVANFWQGGFALGKKDKPINIWFLKFDRLGLAYNYSTTGELRGIKFVFRSLYEL